MKHIEDGTVKHALDDNTLDTYINVLRSFETGLDIDEEMALLDDIRNKTGLPIAIYNPMATFGEFRNDLYSILGNMAELILSHGPDTVRLIKGLNRPYTCLATIGHIDAYGHHITINIEPDTLVLYRRSCISINLGAGTLLLTYVHGHLHGFGNNPAIIYIDNDGRDHFYIFAKCNVIMGIGQCMAMIHRGNFNHSYYFGNPIFKMSEWADIRALDADEFINKLIECHFI